jgi:sirohydrochlorin cobaltochelatase
MIKKLTSTTLFGIILISVFLNPVFAAENKKKQHNADKAAIILASFGTTVPSAVESIINIQQKVQAAFPAVPVRVTFTSNIIRKVWQKRQANDQKWLDQGIPPEILYVKNIISTFGDLREEGYRDIVVQPTHMFFMEQSHDLAQYVQAMRSIRTIKKRWQPFNKIALGRPALGTIGNQYEYQKDLENALRTLAPDVALARKNKANLVYMAHGNEHWSVGIYGEAAKMMRELYPDMITYFGAVEGYPGIEDVSRDLKQAQSNKIILKPFMIVAGDHAVNDMAGDEDDSWKTILTRQGISVIPVLKGLGSNDEFAQLFVAHIKDAAGDMGIDLR